MKWYHGKRILITGASSGIGAAMARQVAGHAAHVILTARSESTLNPIAREVEKDGSGATIIPLDLAEPGAAERLFKLATLDDTRVDVLVNNAGFATTGPFHENDPAVLEEMLSLNVMNLVGLARRFIVPMLERRSGGILNVSSLAAYQPVPRMAAYGASKAFVLGFSQALHHEVRGTGVHVSCLSPGATKSKFFDRAGMARPAGNHPKADPAQVARDGLKALARNKRVKVSGMLTRILTAGAWLAPTPINLAVGDRWLKQAE